MKALLIFCEGNHDIVFVRRSLGAVAGLEFINDPIDKLPSPFGALQTPRHPNAPGRGVSLIVQHYSTRALGGERLSQAAHAPAPAFICALRDASRDQLVLLVRCGTDSAKTKIVELLSNLSATLSNSYGMFVVTEYAVAFVFDADTSIAAREQTFRDDYGGTFSDVDRLSHGGWIRHGDVPVGLFIFADDHGNGTLEAVLAPEVAKRWPGAWTAADDLLNNHCPPDAAAYTKRSERLKAQMTIAGQPYFPGDPLSVAIDRDKRQLGLPPDAFQGPTSQALVTFLQSAPFTP
ncbi:MAG TPA: hypothetical protein DCQ04_05715 [Actinobacteria bacterium]|nr:hypothetical protein [Actinomycetota bacterium]